MSRIGGVGQGYNKEPSVSSYIDFEGLLLCFRVDKARHMRRHRKGGKTRRHSVQRPDVLQGPPCTTTHCIKGDGLPVDWTRSA